MLPVVLPMVVGLLLASAGPARADLNLALAEKNLEKRSKLALENANAAYKTMRVAYEGGEAEGVAAAADEIQKSVELADESLKQTGKIPRKSPKYFKQAEIATRDLLRRLDTFQKEMSFDDRPVLDKVKTKIQQIHDDLLVGLMEGKPR